jgi:hypothetical protein
VFDKDVVKDMCVEFMVGKPEGKRQHGWPRRKWENNIKTEYK